MNLNQSGQFKYLTLDSVVKAESQLNKDLNELKNEIETNELVHNLKHKKPPSSIRTPNDSHAYSIERKYYIERLLNINDTKSIYIQANVFKELIETLNKNEHTLANIPLLLNQFFNDKLQSCIYAKHLHLLRWSRFTQNTNTIENLYPEFKSRLSFILSEYNDANQRLNRLNLSRESLLYKSSSTNVPLCLQTDDLIYYLKWLISHLYSQKNYLQFIKLVEWFPYLKRDSFINEYNNISSKSNNTRDNYSNKDFNDDIDDTDTKNKKSDPVYVQKMIDSLFSSKSSIDIVPDNDDIHNAISFLLNDEEIPILNNNLDYLLPKLRYLTKLYKIDYNLNKMKTQGDEMELFAAVNRKFRHIFAQQEHMNTFKIYDYIEIGNETWGSDTPIHALKKESNWLEYIQLIGEKDPISEKNLSTIKNKYKIDELLKSHSSFIKLSNDDRVIDALRENAPLVKLQRIDVTSVNVTSNKTNFNSNNYWKKIFSNINQQQQQLQLQQYDTNDTNEIKQNELLNDILLSEQIKNPKELSFRAKPKKKSNDFNYVESLQKYGLDDENTIDANETNDNDNNDDTNDLTASGIQGSYLSYLLLRHLRIRDLKRKALSLLNYYYSIQRTLTIYDYGISMDNLTNSSSSSTSNTSSSSNKKAQNYLKETQQGTNLGYHAYMFNSIKDFNINELDFIEFNQRLDNYDDYYTIDNDNDLIHVQDHRGYYIMYDCALNEFNKLEDELQHIISYYIQRDSIINNGKMSNSNRQQQSQQQYKRKSTLSSDDFLDYDLMSYSQKNIDRFGLLLDIWTNEVNYLESKRKLIDVYYEIYQNIFDKQERRQFAQLIQNLISKRPRIDLDSSYFIQSYRLEVNILSKQFKLIKLLANKIIDDMRLYLDKMETSNDQELDNFGLPYKIIKKRLISINLEESAIKNLYFLEYHPWLSTLNRVQDAFKSSINQIINYLNINKLVDHLKIELVFYTKLYDDYECLEPIGNSFTQQLQKDLFNATFIEDPLLMSQLVTSLIKEQEELNKNKTRKESYELQMQFLINTIELVQLRHRLLVSTIDTEFLQQIYLKQTANLGFESYHLYLRYVSFDYAKYKDENELKRAPIYVNELSMQDSKIDRYVSQSNYLAINELDESNLSKFSFKNKDSILLMLKTPLNSIENLQCVLKLQLIHNYLLVSSIEQVNSCQLNLNDTQSINNNSKLKPFSEAFVSIQMEKNPMRDLILNDYIKQRESRSLILQSNPLEMDKLKRSLLNNFVQKLSLRVYQYSLRAQLIYLYQSIKRILDLFPYTRDTHFTFGQSNEFKQSYINANNSSLADENDDLIVDKSNFKKRPRKLLNNSGTRVLNLWFIPHYTDLIIMYKKQNDEQCVKSLTNMVNLIAPFNDILQLLYTNACINTLNCSSNMEDTFARSVKLTSNTTNKTQFSSYENSGGLSNELNELQNEINSLSDPTNPQLISKLLEYKRKILILQYECAFKYIIRDKFIQNGNLNAFKSLNDNIQFTFRYLSNYDQEINCENISFKIPEPVDSNDSLSKSLFPWKYSLNKNGPYQLRYWQSYLIEPYISLCIQGLKDIEKNTINGELLGVSLLFEDYLLFFNNNDNQDEDLFKNYMEYEKLETNLNENLFLNYEKLLFYIKTWKRVELLKQLWSFNKFNVNLNNVKTCDLYQRINKCFKKEILLPVRRTLGKRLDDQLDINDDDIDNLPIVIPKDSSDLEFKLKQISKLLEKLELQMINETSARIQKEIRLVINERNRQDHVLSVDLWKRTCMKEDFTLTRPHIQEKFTQEFLDLAKLNSSNEQNYYLINENDLLKCLNNLGVFIQEREKSNFEQYTMFYENLLKNHHKLLYNKEREIISLKEALLQKTNELDSEVKCQIIDSCYNLILEVTQLRTKVLDLSENKEKLMDQVKKELKQEYIDLINELLNVNQKLKVQFDLFKETTYSQMLELMSKCRTQAIQLSINLKKNFDSAINEIQANQQQTQINLLNDLQKEKSRLQEAILKQNTLWKIKLNTRQCKLNKKLNSLELKSSKQKYKCLEACLVNEEKEILVEQQKQSLKKYLKKLETDYFNLKNKLEKEQEIKSKKENELKKKNKSDKNIQNAKQLNVDKLLNDLEAKESQINELSVIANKYNKMKDLVELKTNKEIKLLKKKLDFEMNLKHDAFSKVDELRLQLGNDSLINESHTLTRPQTAVSNKSLVFKSKTNQSRINTSLSNIQHQQQTLSITPRLNNEQCKLQRAKTANPRTRFIQQQQQQEVDDPALNDDSVFHEQISLLKQIRLNSAIL